MSSPQRACVVLFKDSEGAADYTEALASCGATPMFVPLLDTAIEPADELEPVLRALVPDVAALIFSSQRAVHAFAYVLPRLPCSPPCFAVGPKTVSALVSLGLDVIDCKAPSAEALLPRIVERVAALPIERRRCLFLCGDKRLDTLPIGLRNAGIVCEELLVYKTVCRDPVAVDAEARAGMRAAAASLSSDCPTILVFYSPSGVAVVAETTLLSAPERGAAPQLCVSIGRTTAAAMQASDIPLHALCPTPDAAGVAAAVTALLDLKAAVTTSERASLTASE